jgi:hypothetical protein
VRIPRNGFTIETTGSSCDLRVPILADPNVILRLSAPASAHGIYGLRRQVATIGMQLDDPAGFRSVLNW